VSWKILITASAFANTGQRARQFLRDAGCEIVSSHKLHTLPADLVAKALSGADALLAGLDLCSAAILDSTAAANLKIISRWGVGYDSIDIAAATRNGIVVCNTPRLLDEAVADYTFALLLGLARRVPEANQTVRAGQWTQSWGTDIGGKTLGLIGCGRIGLAVARRASGFSLRLLAYDPTPNPEAQKFGVSFVPLDTLLAESDFVSLHAALTRESRGLLGERQLRKMKSTARLVNAARGALIDESALARALKEAWIAGAALDVFETEPLPAESPLRDAPNLLLSPHQSSFALETGERVSLVAMQAILDLMSGRPPQHVVNPEVFSSPALRARIQP
jgi:phosphoglycerate dehydrogenase-like enzyme